MTITLSNRTANTKTTRNLVTAAMQSAPVVQARHVLSADEIICRLEEGGATLLALPSRGYTTNLQQMRYDVVHTALEAYGWEAPPMRAPVPSATAITAMDEAFSWLRFIPDSSFVLRRILGARALVHPLTGRHLFSWRRLAAVLGADHRSIQRWHDTGIQMLETGLKK